jgi:hypothetical protein
MGRVPKISAVVLTSGSKRPGNSKTDRYKSSSGRSGRAVRRAREGRTGTGVAGHRTGMGRAGAGKVGAARSRAAAGTETAVLGGRKGGRRVLERTISGQSTEKRTWTGL